MKVIASPYLKIFLLEYYKNPSRHDYNIVFSRRLFGPIDLKKLELAFEKTIEESVILNSHLYVDNENKIYWEKNSSNPRKKFSYFKNTSNKESFIKTPFDLFKGPLYRFALFQIDKRTHDIVIILHYCLIDAQSMNTFVERISSYYNEISIKELPTLEQQRKFITHSSNLLGNDINFLYQNNKGETFWKDRLKNFNFRNTLPYIRSQQNITSTNISIIQFRVNKTLALQRISSKLDFSYFNILSTIWGILIARYCNSDKANVLFPISIRNVDNNIYGAYVNILIHGIDISNNKTYMDLVYQYKREIEKLRINNIHKYSNYPIHDIVSTSKIKQINVAFGATNVRETRLNLKPCKEVINIGDEVDIAGSEVYLGFQENQGSFTFKLYYNNNLFKKYQITEIIECYRNLLSKISKNPLEVITKINLLNKESTYKLLYKWNATDKPYPSDRTIHSLFEEQVIKSPNNVAVIYEDIRLTYKELNEKANRLANYIIKHYDIKPDSLIALLLDRSENMIISILGVLKAGAAYVPMDREHPDERIEYILDDTNTNLVISNKCYDRRIGKISKKVGILSIDDKSFIKGLDKYPKTNLKVNNLTSSNLAYIIYTSGTTGKPKGVMIQHCCIVNLAITQNREFNNIENKKIRNYLAYANYIFDAHIWEIFTSLVNNHKLYIIAENKRLNTEYLSNYIKNNKINIALLPPILVDKNQILNLDILLMGGEKMSLSEGLCKLQKGKECNMLSGVELQNSKRGKHIIKFPITINSSMLLNNRFELTTYEVIL